MNQAGMTPNKSLQRAPGGAAELKRYAAEIVFPTKRHCLRFDRLAAILIRDLTIVGIH